MAIYSKNSRLVQCLEINLSVLHTMNTSKKVCHVIINNLHISEKAFNKIQHSFIKNKNKNKNLGKSEIEGYFLSFKSPL